MKRTSNFADFRWGSWAENHDRTIETAGSEVLSIWGPGYTGDTSCVFPPVANSTYFQTSFVDALDLGSRIQKSGLSLRNQVLEDPFDQLFFSNEWLNPSSTKGRIATR